MKGKLSDIRIILANTETALLSLITQIQNQVDSLIGEIEKITSNIARRLGNPRLNAINWRPVAHDEVSSQDVEQMMGC